MFQLERLNVVEETLNQIVSEMNEQKIETTNGMVGKAQSIVNSANEIMRLVSNERYRRGLTHEDC